MADNRSFFQRLTQIFRSGPAIQRRIKGYDQRPANNQLIQGNFGYRSGAPFGFGRENTPFSILGAYGILDRMARYSEFCFSEDTLIYTTDGTFTIKELSEKYPNGEIFHVYSYDHENKKIVISTAHHPRITKNAEKQKLVKIIFDDGGHIKTTLDHKFILRDGTHMEAKDLYLGASLMPFNMRKYTGNYHQIYLLNKDENSYGWAKEHVMVAEYFAGRKLKEDEVVHHADFNPENNSISNLKIMNVAEHKTYHANLNNKNKFNKTNLKHSDWMRKNNPAKRSDITFDRIFDTAVGNGFSMAKTSKILNADMNVIKNRLREVGFANWVEFSACRGELETIRTASRIIVEMNKEATLSVDNLVDVAASCNTIYEAANVFKTTPNVIRRILERDGKTWSDIKKSTKFVSVKRKGVDNFRFDKEISYQKICEAYSSGIGRKELAEKLNTTVNKIHTRLKNEGFHSWGEWTKIFENHKIKEIQFLEEEETVYNVTVDDFHNLAAGSVNPSESYQERPQSMVIIAQSEMEYTPEIARALDILAEEAVGGDDRGKCFHVYSKNSEIKGVLEELFFDVLNVEFNLKPWTRNLCKYGDFFLFNEILPDIGVVTATPIRVNEIEREEGFDMEDPYAIRFKWLSRGNKYLENWQVSHFRIQGNDLFIPYGTSLLESSRRIWRQLIMYEDAMLTYRIVRSPERRVFYIDVGHIPAQEVPNYLESVKSALRSRGVMDRSTGREDMRHNAQSMLDDYFIPVRGDKTGTKIDTLSGGQHITATEDVEFIQAKLFAALQVPKPYLNYTENMSAKASLSQMDIRFSRTISSLQKILLSELNKLAMIHLYAKGYDGPDLSDFELKLSNPSSVALQQKLELWTAKFDLAGTAKDTRLVDEYWIQKNILELSNDELKDITDGLRIDRLRDIELESMEPVEPDLTQPSKTTDTFNPINYEMTGAGVPKTPAEDTADNTGRPGLGLDLEPGEDDDFDFDKIEDGDVGSPIRATPFLTQHKRNRTRRVGVGRGRENTAMPDAAAMLSPKNKYNKDVYGTKTENTMLHRRLKEIEEKKEYNIVIEPNFGREMSSILRKMESVFRMKNKRNELLIEEIEFDIDLIEDENQMLSEMVEYSENNEELLESVEEKTLAEVFKDES